MKKIYGAPGCGKTTELMQVVLEELKSGLSIEDISYMGFTRAACTEALTRAQKITPFPDPKKRYWFKTIHATCLQLILSNGLGNDRTIAKWADLREFCELNGLEPPNLNDEDVVSGGQVSTGSAFFSTYSYLLNTFRKPAQYKECPHADAFDGLDYEEVHKAWDEYKDKKKLIDFTDMLVETFENALNVPTTVLIVDEFQDISPLQLELVKQFAVGKESIYVAGDDDQALYGFQGADPKLMLDFQATETKILGASHRCPEEVWKPSLDLINLNKNRQFKDVKSKGPGGLFREVMFGKMGHILLHTQGSTFILARTNALVGKIAWQLAFNSTLFKYLDGEKERVWGWNKKRTLAMNKILAARNPWAEFDYISRTQNWARGSCTFLKCYLRHYSSCGIDPATIDTKIGTIHSAKGREADTVVVFNDLTARVAAAMENDIESERRVWYVAMTRAKQRVIWVDGFFGTGKTFQLTTN